jgi:hypothetical protein
VAEIDAVVAVVTVLVVALNVAFVAPAGTVTLVGTLTTALLSDSVTTAPPEGAGPESVTVPVDELPPVTPVGFIASDARVGAAACVVGVKLRLVENEPNAPAALRARTRQ